MHGNIILHRNNMHGNIILHRNNMRGNNKQGNIMPGNVIPHLLSRAEFVENVNFRKIENNIIIITPLDK